MQRAWTRPVGAMAFAALVAWASSMGAASAPADAGGQTAAAPARPAAASPQAPAAVERLVREGDLVRVGSFRVPADAGGPENRGLAWGGTALAYHAANNSLFIVGHNWDQWAAEISIPPMDGTARLLQPLSDPVEGMKFAEDDDKVGGQLVYNGQLLITKFGYYDATGSQKASHVTRPLNLSIKGQVRGPFVVGKLGVGFYSGYMANVPASWQARLGGPVLTGNCCLSIVSRTSYGPAVAAFDPATLGTKADAVALVYYTQDRQTLGEYGIRGVHPVFNGTTRVRGVVFPEGTTSVLFFGTTGVGSYCYGYAPDCGAPGHDKGEHAYPYRAYVWAYNANDLAAVRAGRMRPWDVKPYATWVLPLPNADVVMDAIGGTAYDPATGRIFVAQKLGDSDRPLIHVFKLR